MNEFVLSLGSNLPPPEGELHLQNVRVELMRETENLRFSQIYRTQAEGACSGTYANCIAKGCTSLPLDQMERLMKAIESRYGRTAETRARGLVPLDLDIVCWNDRVLRPKNWSMHYMQPGLDELTL